MTEANVLPAALTLQWWGLQPATFTFTFDGLDLDSLAGDWTLELTRRSHDRTAIYTIAATQVGDVLTATITEVQSTALIGNTSGWEGFWRLVNSTAPRAYVAGPAFTTTDTARLSQQAGQGVAVTVEDTTVTVEVTTVGTATDVAVDPAGPLTSDDVTTQDAIDRVKDLAGQITSLDASSRARRGVAQYEIDGSILQVASIGDSVMDHFNATTTGGYSEMEIFRTELRQIFGLSTDGTGHRKATTLDSLEPNFEIGASDPAWNAIGFGMDGTFLDYNDTVTIQVEIVTGGKITVNWNQQNTSTLSYLEVVSSIDGTLTGSGLDGYSASAGGFAGIGYATWTSATLTAGTHTFTFRCKTDAVKQDGVTFNNVIFNDQDIQIWNGGHFGATTSTWLTQTLSGHYLNLDLLGSDGIDADLVIVQLGLNEDDADEFKQGLIDIVTEVHALQDEGEGASFIFCTPWSKGAGSAPARTEEENEEFVQAVYDAAAEVGAFVLPTHKVIADGYTNALGLLDTDRIHPNDEGHRALGLYLAREVAAFLGVPAGGGGGTVDTSGFVDTSSAQTVGGAKNFTSDLTVTKSGDGTITVGSASTIPYVGVKVTGDTQFRALVSSAGVGVGSGSSAIDAYLGYSAAGVVSVNKALSWVGLTGATAVGRIVGWTSSGAPASGTFSTGDVVIAKDGEVWICTSGGTQGTWVKAGSATYATLAGTSNLIDAAGDSLTGSADNTLAKLAKGTALQYRRMNSGANGEEWGDLPEAVQDVMGALSAGGTGLTMTYNDGSNTWVLDVDTEVYAVAQTLNAQTDSYTLVLEDAGKLVTLNKASAVTLTIPANASVAYPVGTRIDIAQLGAGQVTIAITSDTVNATPGLKLRAQYSGATLVKLTSTTWIAFGDLSAVANTPPAFRSADSTQFTAGSSSVVVTKPSGVVNGDLLIAWGRINGTTETITPPAGWTQLQSGTTVVHSYLWWKVAASEGSNYTFTTTTGQAGRVSIAAFSGSSGIDNSGMVETGSIVNTPGGFTAPSFSTTHDNCLVVFCCVFGVNSNTVTPAAGYTEHQDTAGTAPNTELADIVQATAGSTGTPSATITTNSNGTAFLVSLKP